MLTDFEFKLPDGLHNHVLVPISLEKIQEKKAPKFNPLLEGIKHVNFNDKRIEARHATLEADLRRERETVAPVLSYNREKRRVQIDNDAEVLHVLSKYYPKKSIKVAVPKTDSNYFINLG